MAPIDKKAKINPVASDLFGWLIIKMAPANIKGRTSINPMPITPVLTTNKLKNPATSRENTLLEIFALEICILFRSAFKIVIA